MTASTVAFSLDQFKDHLASEWLSDVETGLLGLQFLYLPQVGAAPAKQKGGLLIPETAVERVDCA